MARVKILTNSSLSHQVLSSQGVQRHVQNPLLFGPRLCVTLTACADFNAGIGLVRMMGVTNFLALVGGGKSPKFAMNKVRPSCFPERQFHLCLNCFPGHHMGRHEG